MSFFLSSVFSVILATMLAAPAGGEVGVGAAPPLVPPSINAPLYECGDTVGYLGAKPGADVYIYINCKQVKVDQNSKGHATISLSKPLQAGDIVYAVQKHGGLTSAATTPPVTVSPIPCDWIDACGKLEKTPKIYPDLVDCSQVMFITDTHPGSTVIVRRSDCKEMLPAVTPSWGKATNVLLFPPKLDRPMKEGESYQVMMELCDGKYKSDWSEWVVVQPAPKLTTPVICEPIIVGQTKCLVKNLTRGATVKIFDSSTGKEVGSKLAFQPDTVVDNIDPPGFEAGHQYYAEQSLCKQTEKSAIVSPQPSLKTPSLAGRIYAHHKMIKVCNTILGSSVEVHHIRKPLTTVFYAVGNCGCLDVKLPGTISLVVGDVVKVRQIVGGKTSRFSTEVTVR